jgi:hypothetical protein
MGWVNTISTQKSAEIQSKTIGPIPTLELNCPQLKGKKGTFLVDTGANVSLISKNMLERVINMCKTTIPVKSSSGDLVSILGSIPLSLTAGSFQLDPHHFWITDQVFPRYCGIIGTDLLSKFNASIHCREKILQLRQPGMCKQVKIPLHYPSECDLVSAFNATPVFSENLRNQSKEVRASQEQVIPPNSTMNLECMITRTPWLNLPHEVEATMISYAGVWVGRAWVSLNPQGYFPVPTINTTDQPFVVKRNQLITQASPLFPGDIPSTSSSTDGLESMDTGGEAGYGFPDGQTGPSKCNQGEPDLGRTKPEDTGTTVGTAPRGDTSDAAAEVESEPDFTARQVSVQDATQEPKDPDSGGQEETSTASSLPAKGSSQAEEADTDDRRTQQGGFNREGSLSYTSTEIPGSLNLVIRKDGPKPQDEPVKSPEARDDRTAADAMAPTTLQVQVRHTAVPDTPREVHEFFKKRVQEGKINSCPGETQEPGEDVPPTMKYLDPQVQSPTLWIQGKEPWDMGLGLKTASIYESRLPDVKAPFLVKDMSTYRQGSLANCAERCQFDYTHEATPEVYTAFYEPPEVEKSSNKDLKKKLEQAAGASDLLSKDQGKLRSLLFEYQDIFRTGADCTSSCPIFTQAIELTDNEPVFCRQYPLPRASRDAVKQHMEEFLKAGIIRPSKSPYNSPLWVVKKPQKDQWRPVVDF